MGYINLVTYVQHKIDNILRRIQAWAQAYIDNIVHGAKSLLNLFDKLRVLFEIFLHYNISIKSTKSFFNYLDIGFLDKESTP